MTKEKKDWDSLFVELAKEFSDKITFERYNKKYIGNEDNSLRAELLAIEFIHIHDKIEQFIQQTLNQRNEEIIKMIEEELKIWNSNGEYYDNVSKSLNNITNKIKELNK